MDDAPNPASRVGRISMSEGGPRSRECAVKSFLCNVLSASLGGCAHSDASSPAARPTALRASAPAASAQAARGAATPSEAAAGVGSAQVR